MFQLCIFDVFFTEWLNAKYEIRWGKNWNLIFQYFLKFQHLLGLAYFHNFMVYPTFFTLKLLNWHLIHLISQKKLVLNSLFLLLRPLEYVYPLIYQWTKTLKNITDKYLFRKLLNIIYRFVFNNCIPFIWENKKWKNLEV